MARPFDALERVMEQAVEGTVQRLFRPKLQPVQLAKAAAREMDQHQIIGPSGPEVPNSYRIALSTADFEAFARFRVALQRELEKYLEKYAADRGWRPVSRTSVELLADPAVRSGRVRVVAEMRDSAPSSPSSGLPFDVPIEQTVRQPRVAPRSPERSGHSDRTANLLGEGGERFGLGRPVVTVGRALENDVVIADGRVSRFHAELRQQDGRYVLHDLGSTNGTQVADEDVDERELADGDAISLGGYRLTFRETEPDY